MSVKLLLIKVAKPVAVAAAVGASAYGYREWERAKNALQLSTNDVDMTKLFDTVDSDHSGFIDKKELKVALRKAGVNVNMISLEAMMNVADENGDGKISKEEWLHICHHLHAEKNEQNPRHVPVAPPKPSAAPVLHVNAGEEFDKHKK